MLLSHNPSHKVAAWASRTGTTSRKCRRGTRPDGRHMVRARHCGRELARGRVAASSSRLASSRRRRTYTARPRRSSTCSRGSGLTLLDDKAYEIRAGDCIVYKNFHEAHTIRAGDDGLDVIAFGAREYLPPASCRAAARCGRSRASSRSRRDTRGTGSLSSSGRSRKLGRPATIVNMQDVEPAGARRTATDEISRARRAPAGPA